MNSDEHQPHYWQSKVFYLNILGRERKSPAAGAQKIVECSRWFCIYFGGGRIRQPGYRPRLSLLQHQGEITMPRYSRGPHDG
jgi:hypothetical protein